MFDQPNSQFEIVLTPKHHQHSPNDYLDESHLIYEELLLNNSNILDDGIMINSVVTSSYFVFPLFR